MDNILLCNKNEKNMTTTEGRKPIPLKEPYELGESQWMVPCIIDAFQRKFVALCKPPELGGEMIQKTGWSEKEDELLRSLIVTKGIKKWTAISKELNKKIHSGEEKRHGKQCRERWYNHLNPELKKTDWTNEEDELILKKQKLLGNKWSVIAKELPGRTENSVKNRWKSIMKKANKQATNTESDDKTNSQVETGGETGKGEGGFAEDIPATITRISSFASRYNPDELYSIQWNDPFEDIYDDCFSNNY